MCGAQPTPVVCGMLWISSVRRGIPTKTPLAFSQFSGKLCSFWRVPLHVFSTRSSWSALLPYLFLLVRILSCSRRSFIVLRVKFLASCGEICLSVFSGVVSRSLLQRIFHIWNAHSDITIRNRRVAQCRVTPFPDRIFRRGRAMMVVMSRPVGQAISFISHSFFAIFHTSVLWFASQLNTMCCIVSGEPHFVQVPLSLRFVILSQYLPHLRASGLSFHRHAFYFYFPWPVYNT